MLLAVLHRARLEVCFFLPVLSLSPTPASSPNLFFLYPIPQLLPQDSQEIVVPGKVFFLAP